MEAAYIVMEESVNTTSGSFKLSKVAAAIVQISARSQSSGDSSAHVEYICSVISLMYAFLSKIYSKPVLYFLAL